MNLKIAVLEDKNKITNSLLPASATGLWRRDTV